jgi:hypothetical protein
MRTLSYCFCFCLIYCLALWPAAPKAIPIIQPQHQQYIQDSIQPPIPQHPIQIEIRVAYLPPNTVGQTYPINTSQYLILLNPQHRDKWPLTLLHELVHVKQFKLQRLQWNAKTREWSWLGQPINWLTPWPERPWEQEAEQEALNYSTNYKPRAAH